MSSTRRRYGPKRTLTTYVPVAAAAHLRSDEDFRDAHRDAADAKARIAIYGGNDVIKALSRFEEAGAVLSDGPGAKAFVSLVSAMRSGAALPERDLELRLLGATRNKER